MQKGSIQKKPWKFDADAAGKQMQNCAKLRKYSTNVRRKLTLHLGSIYMNCLFCLPTRHIKIKNKGDFSCTRTFCTIMNSERKATKFS
jgi:hypothetical protein